MAGLIFDVGTDLDTLVSDLTVETGQLLLLIAHTCGGLSPCSGIAGLRPTLSALNFLSQLLQATLIILTNSARAKCLPGSCPPADTGLST